MQDHPRDKDRSSSQTGEAGGALWFILLAIAMLVALTMTITRSTDNSQQNGSRERDRILASDILRQARGMAAIADQARGNGIPENNISFENTTVPGYTTVFSSSSSSSTVPYGLFYSSGGGLTYTVPNSEWLDAAHASETSPKYGEWYFYGTTCIPEVGTGTDAGTCAASPSTSELIVGLPWITASLCTEINRQAGIENLTGPIRAPIATTSVYGTVTKFVGEFSTGGLLVSSGNQFSGKQAGCFQGGGGSPNGGYHFYEVLIAR
ncbi:MAG: hypothetical protein JWO78_2218 [Micavibrio sp.]|nr:hypothetical protein [Micavibrio sp.]